jgi:tryptophan 2,3-dioxygenase
MTVCKSIRDKIAFRFIRFGFRIALKNRFKYGYLKYLFKGDTYTFESKEQRDIMSLLKTDDERLKSPSEMQIEVSEKIEKSIKAEAVKEFAERLKSHYDQYDDYDDIYAHHIRDDIDFLVEEMVGAD